jgi:predicted amidohydrolase
MSAHRLLRIAPLLLLALPALACATPRPLSVKVAAVQCPSEMGDVEANRARLTRLVREAAANGAKIVVLPEAAITGYLSQDLALTWYVPGKPLDPVFNGLHPERAAEPVPGASTDHFCALARELGIYLTIPFVEEAGPLEKPIYYNTVCLAAPTGEMVAHHRKLRPWPHAERSWAEDGDRGYAVVDTPYGRVGLALCHDVHPIFGHLKTERVWIVLHPVARVTEESATDWFRRRLPSGVAAYGFHLVGACWSVDAERDWNGYGYSLIVSPRGQLLAAAKTRTGDEIIYAELETAPIPLDE